jgi:hypothetical protein
MVVYQMDEGIFDTWCNDGGDWVMHDVTVPNYPNDLNAMHEAEALKLTTLSLRMDYLAHLFDLSEGFASGYPPGYGKAHSTARQRATAFVLTMEGT